MTTRQELYDRIRETSKNEVILEEMVRLGFWPDQEGIPNSPASEIKRKGELEREFRSLTSDNRRLQNVDQIKKAQRQKRLKESKQKKIETKERKLKERADRAEEWKKKKESQITFLGSEYSVGLQNENADLEKLNRHHLGHLSTVEQLANSMNVSVGLLRYLAFGRKVSKTTHYKQFSLKKKSGGIRKISAPMPRLKNAQRWILDNILSQFELNEAAHGFRPSRSIVSNAVPHVGAKVVINADMKDFFPTVHYRRIKGVFRSLGFSEAVSIVLALLCSESEQTQVELDQETFYVARGQRFLPQGAPTSPAITNLICRGLDARLEKTAAKLGFTYTRYADDITFSSKNSDADVGMAIRRIKFAVADEGFTIHPDKTRILRSGRRLEVTGLTVNKKVSVSRKELRKFRATLHQIERDGSEGKSWGNSGNVLAAIQGYANFVSMVDPEKGKPFQEKVQQILNKFGKGICEFEQRKPWEEKSPMQPVDASDLSANKQDENGSNQRNLQVSKESSSPMEPKSQEKKPWWKFW